MCKHNNIKVAKHLLKNGAKKSINKANIFGCTALWHACANNNIDLAKLLLYFGATASQKELDVAKGETKDLLTKLHSAAEESEQTNILQKALTKEEKTEYRNIEDGIFIFSPKTPFSFNPSWNKKENLKNYSTDMMLKFN